MSDAASLAVSLSRSRRLAGAGTISEKVEPIDTTATYRFPFARQRWLVGVGVVVQGTLMMITGGFLLTQVSSTPNLAIQIAIVGTLLAGGGLAILTRAWSDFLGGLTIDRDGLRASLGWSSFTMPWADVARWRVSETAANIVDLSSIEIWTAKSKFPRVVPGGRLSVTDHHRLRQLFYAFAEGKENA
jgi:hypothetical protein